MIPESIEMHDQLTIVRYGVPGKLDKAPKGTWCKVVSSNSESYVVYEQKSSNEDKPLWEVRYSITIE